MKAERKGNTTYTEKINTHVWMVYRGKDFIEKFVEHIKDEVKWLHARFSQQPMTEIIERIKQQKNVISVLKSLLSLRTER